MQKMFVPGSWWTGNEHRIHLWHQQQIHRTQKQPLRQTSRLPSWTSSLRTAEHKSLWSTVAHYFCISPFVCDSGMARMNDLYNVKSPLPTLPQNNNKSFTMYYKVMEFGGSNTLVRSRDWTTSSQQSETRVTASILKQDRINSVFFHNNKTFNGKFFGSNTPARSTVFSYCWGWRGGGLPI